MMFSLFSQTASPAIRRYTSGMALAMSSYVLATLGTASLVHRHAPRGVVLYALCAVPALCIFAMLAVLAKYLRDEKDEYQRLVVVRSILAATFVLLALSAYVDFLRSFGHLPALPAFTDFLVFWIVFGLSQAIQYMGNRSHE